MKADLPKDHRIISAGATMDLSDYTDAQLEVAKSRRPVVERLVNKKGRTVYDVETASVDLGITSRQLYNIINAYAKDPCIGSLIGAKRGRKRGSRSLSPAVEAIISEAIRTKYLSEDRKSIHHVVREVHAHCHFKQLPKPSINTVKARINQMDDRKVDRKREGYKVARR